MVGITSCHSQRLLKTSTMITTNVIYKDKNKSGQPYKVSIGFKAFRFQAYRKIKKDGSVKLAMVMTTPDKIKIPVSYFEPTNEVSLDGREIFKDEKGKFVFKDGKLPKREYL